MQKEPGHLPRANRGTLTRREVLAGAAIAALAVGAPAALAAPVSKRRRPLKNDTVSKSPMRRYMAASATLGDGRIIVAGGYDRPFDAAKGLRPLNSVAIFDPGTGVWIDAPPMTVARARHAAVALADGRVAVLGGLGIRATASVEIYDPKTNSWTGAASLQQPRYDHSAALSGDSIYIVGGSSLSMLATTENYSPIVK